MVLKVGEKQVGTSIASLAQRRGVTPSYSGDPLGSAAKEIKGGLDVLQARAATLLDLEYRVKASSDATKELTKLERTYPFDSAGFMNAANAYLEEKVNQAPERYKAWTKQLMNPLIASKGDSIWTEENNIKNQERIKDYQSNHRETMDNIHNTLLKMDIGQFDEYITGDGKGNIGFALQSVSELQSQYESLYYSLPSSARGQLDTPEEWLRKQKIAVEEFRFESYVTQILSGAAEKDLQNFISDPSGLQYKEEDLVFSQTYKELGKLLNTYIKDPSAIKTENHKSSILADTTVEEREQIVAVVKDAMENAKSKSDASFSQYKIMQDINKKKIEDAINSRIDNFDFKTINTSDADFAKNMFNYGFSGEEIASLLTTKQAKETIYKNALNIEKGASSTNLNNLSNTIMQELKDNGTYSDASEVKQELIDALVTLQIRPRIGATQAVAVGAPFEEYQEQPITIEPEFFNINTIDFFEVEPNGDLKYQAQLDAMNKLISVHNVIPTPLKHAFGNAEYLNMKNFGDFKTALAIGNMASSIASRGYYPDDLSESEILDIDNWKKFNEAYKRVDLSDPEISKQIPEFEKVLVALHTPITDGFYSQITNKFDQMFTFDYFDESENVYNIAEIIFDDLMIERNANSGASGFFNVLFGEREFGVNEMNQIAMTLREPFYTIVANDIKNELTLRGVSSENMERGITPIPKQFKETDYILSAIERSLKMVDPRKYGFID